jgi:hypothetical protein
MAEFTHVLQEIFDWPNGIVVGNLLASVLWAAPAFVKLHRKLDLHHRERMALMHRQHRELKEALLPCPPGDACDEVPTA